MAITVLGKTFETEEERREYFREELRKKLPELKKMEGFPVGHDEDIIELSDPPYYTACPNPWFNSFIDEWDNEVKIKSEAQINKPLTADVSEGKSDKMYKAHTYHTKVPYKAIMRYLIHYTKPGDVVLDAFCGSGMTGIATQMCDFDKSLISMGFDVRDGNKLFLKNEFVGEKGIRRVLLKDLAPSATNLSFNNNTDADIEEFKTIATNILDKVEKKYEWLFTTLDENTNRKHKTEFYVWSEITFCENCLSEHRYTDLVLDEEFSKKKKNEIKCPDCGKILSSRKMKPVYETKYDEKTGEAIEQPKRELILVCYKKNRKKYYREPNQFDLKLARKAEELKYDDNIPNFEFPDMQMMRVGRMKPTRITHLHHFYYSRLRIILSELWTEGQNIKNDRIKRLFKYLLDSNFVNLSLRNRFRPNVSYPYNPLNGVFYVPMMTSEANPFVAYRNKLKRIIKAFRSVKFKDNSTIISTGSATDMEVKDNSVDYVFTDPPFGENIYYSDLNFFIEAWEKVLTNTKNEAIVDRVREKNISDYNHLVESCFKEYFRVLKNGKWMTVVFSNTKAAVWNGIQTALQNSGFVVVNVSALDKKQGSFQSVNTTTAVKQDLVISCFKPTSKLIDKAGKNSQIINHWDFVQEYLSRVEVYSMSDNSLNSIFERFPKKIYDKMVAFYIQKGLSVPIDASKFQKGLRERFIERDGMFFTNEQVQEYDRKKAEVPNFTQLSILVASEQDGVLWLQNFLKNEPKTYQDIQPEWMQALGGERKGDIIPELKTILEENFLKNDAGEWFVPDPNKEEDLEKLRNRRLLKQFGDYKEQAFKPKGKIKECRVEALRAGFKQSYQDKDFETIVRVGDRIPENLLMEDEVLLQFYDIAASKV